MHSPVFQHAKILILLPKLGHLFITSLRGISQIMFSLKNYLVGYVLKNHEILEDKLYLLIEISGL